MTGTVSRLIVLFAFAAIGMSGAQDTSNRSLEKKVLQEHRAIPQTASESSRAAQFREADVTLNGLRFHYLEWPTASAPAMLLLPGTGGGGGCAESWGPFASAMRDRYHIYAMEQRGQCDSEWAKEYTWQLVLQDIDAFVDKFHLAPVTIVGHSSGALWGHLYAAEHPEKVARLVAVDGSGASTWPKTRAEAQKLPPLASRHVTFSSPEEAITTAKTRWRTDASVDAVVRDFILRGIRKLDDGRWGLRQDPAAVAASDQYLFFPIGDELNAAFPRTKCPTLIVRGSQGAVTPEIAEQVAHQIPNGNWVEVPNAGHVVHLANPAGFLAAVRPFLTSDAADRAAQAKEETARAKQEFVGAAKPRLGADAEPEINRIREESRRAFLEGDYATIDRLWADDYLSTTSWGAIRTKAEALQGLRKGERKFLSLDYDDIKVRIYGNAAVETGHVTYRALVGGREIPGNGRYMLIFIKQPAGWRLVAHQATNIAPEGAEPIRAQATERSSTSMQSRPGWPNGASAAEREVLQVEKERAQAVLHNDATALDKLMDEEFVVTDVQGIAHDRADELSLYANGRRQTQSWEPSDVRVRVYGDSAVVTERAAVKDVLEGKGRDIDIRLTHVWVKRDGRWQAVARQATRIGAPPTAINGPTSSPPEKKVSDQTQQEVLALDEQFEEAYKKGDLSREEMLSEDYVGIGVSGTVFTKITGREFFKSGHVKTLGHEVTDRKIRVYDQTAVVTGTRHIQDTIDGKRRDEYHRYTRVWVRRNGKWQVVSFQATKIATQVAPEDKQ